MVEEDDRGVEQPGRSIAIRPRRDRAGELDAGDGVVLHAIDGTARGPAALDVSAGVLADAPSGRSAIRESQPFEPGTPLVPLAGRARGTTMMAAIEGDPTDAGRLTT